MGNEYNIADIVHIVAIEDIRVYVSKKRWEDDYCGTMNYDFYINSETKKIADYFKDKGYEIFDIDRYNKVVKDLKTDIAELRKSNEFLEEQYKRAKHNVSMLQKKLNKIEVKDLPKNSYCSGIDCAWCDEPEPCKYREMNRLEHEGKL